MIMVPYRVIFDADAEGEMWTFELMVTLTFIVDLVATFNTAYLERERWIVTRGDIAKRYLQGWFWIDFPASIPVELILLMLSDAGANGDVKMLKVLRGLRLVRLLRLLKVGGL